MNDSRGMPHVVEEGSRDHVVWWDSSGRHCSNPNCEINFEEFWIWEHASAEDFLKFERELNKTE